MKNISEIDEAIRVIMEKPLSLETFIELTHLMSKKAQLMRIDQDKRIFIEDLVSLGVSKSNAREFNSLRNEALSHPRLNKSHLQEKDKWIRETIVPQVLRTRKRAYSVARKYEEDVFGELKKLADEKGYTLSTNVRIESNFGEVPVDAILEVGKTKIPIEVKFSSKSYIVDETAKKLEGIMDGIDARYGILIVKGTQHQIGKPLKNMLVINERQIMDVLPEWIDKTATMTQRKDWMDEHFALAQKLAIKCIDILIGIIRGQESKRAHISEQLMEFSEFELGATLTKGQVRSLLRSNGVFRKMGLDSRIKAWTNMPTKDSVAELKRLKSQISKLTKMP